MLELKNISAGYGNKTVLDSVTATFEKGKLTSIIGSNGCGKSTLLKAILGILPISVGEIAIDGNSISRMKRNDIAQKIAYLAQGKNTPDMTVEQMVLHGRFPHLSYPRRYKDLDREIARNAMEEVGVSHLKKEPLFNLSGGMRQNAYIAMALAQDTDYILLDEPTTYLDISRQRELMQLLKRLADNGKGIVTVMHDIPMALDFCDRIAVLQDRKITALDEPSKIYDLDILKDIFGVKIVRLPNGKFYYDY